MCKCKQQGSLKLDIDKKYFYCMFAHIVDIEMFVYV